jgi:hypothetical protein
MCVYSVMSDWAHRWIPQPGIPPWTPSPSDPYPYPEPATPRQVEWDPQMLKEFRDLLERVKRLDEQGGTKPCLEADERKQDFLADIKEQLDRIERNQDQNSN